MVRRVDRHIVLSFEKTDCERCGSVRILMTPCPDCGAPPKAHETQPDLERRRKLVRSFREHHPTTREASVSFQDALELAVTLPARINGAIARAARSGTSESWLIASFDELNRLVNQWTQRQRRPLTNRARALGMALTELRDGFEVFLDTLAAPDIHTAQQLESAGQARLDGAGDKATLLARLAEGDGDLELSVADYLGKLVAGARHEVGNPQSVAELDTLLRAHHGRDEGSAAGLGVQDHLFRAVLTSMLDLENGLAVATSTERIFERNAQASRIMESSAWQRQHGRVRALLAAEAHSLVNSSDDSAFEMLKASLDMVVVCRDGAIRHALATLLATDADDYERRVWQNAGRLIGDAARLHPELRLDENLNMRLRHAAAHVDFDLVEGGVLTHRNGAPDLIPDDDFLDGSLAYIEMAMAFLFGIEARALDLGVDIEVSAHMSDRDRAHAVSFMASLIGFSDVRASFNGTELEVEARGDPKRILDLGAMASTVTTRHSALRANVTLEDGRVATCMTDLEVHRRTDINSRAEMPDLMLQMATVVAATEVDGSSIWSSDEWVRGAEVVGVLQPGEEVLLAAKRIRAFRDLAKSQGEAAAVRACDLRREGLIAGKEQPAAPPALVRRKTGR